VSYPVANVLLDGTLRVFPVGAVLIEVCPVGLNCITQEIGKHDKGKSLRFGRPSVDYQLVVGAALLSLSDEPILNTPGYPMLPGGTVCPQHIDHYHLSCAKIPDLNLTLLQKPGRYVVEGDLHLIDGDFE
jgi:hypothetical protein